MTPDQAPSPPLGHPAEAVSRTPATGVSAAHRWSQAVTWLTCLLVVAVGAYAWQTSRRLGHLEAELVKRQETSQSSAQEALLLAKQSQELARDASAQVALLNAKMAEVAQQRAQLDTLVHSLTQSRDDNILSDIDASLRVAMQQSALTGSAEALVSALQAADERLSRSAQPRFETVRRALLKDLDDLRSTQLSDVASLAIRLDEVIRLVDDLPLLSQARTPMPDSSGQTKKHKNDRPSESSPPVKAAVNADGAHWSDRLMHWGQSATQSAWQEAKALIRVTRIAQPEAALLAPEQAYFLKENLKLRLLNARLSLLSRQTGTAQAALQNAKQTIDKYFDARSRKTAMVKSLLNEVAIQARAVQVPSPDDTFAALHTLGAKP